MFVHEVSCRCHTGLPSYSPHRDALSEIISVSIIKTQKTACNLPQVDTLPPKLPSHLQEAAPCGAPR